MCIIFVLPSTTGTPLRSCRSRSNSQFRRFRVVSIGPCKYVFIPISSLNPRRSLEYSFSFAWFLCASVPLVSIIYVTSKLYPAKVSMDSVFSLLAPTSFHTSSTTLSHLLPARPVVTFSHTPLSAMVGNLFFSTFRALYCNFNFYDMSVLSGCIRSSPLHTLLLVVLEHPSTFSAAVICSVSSWFANCAFPPHTSPAYYSFGTITFIIVHILILVSSCVCWDGIHLAYVCSTVSYHFCYVCIPRASF